VNVAKLGWQDEALCQQVGGDMFYSEVGEDTERAKAVCRGCLVRLECLEYALEVGDREGIFGGFSERPRRRIAREHQAGKSLEDVIAEDDARFYGRIERSAELAEATTQRNRARERARYRAVRAALNDLEIAS
jgi:WhiB family redox-sensing transcriptional regulator